MGRRRRGRRSSVRARESNALRVESQHLSLISPNTSCIIGWSSLPPIATAASFKLTKLIVTAVSRDSATANSYVDGPGFFQIRQLAPDGKITLRSSTVLMAGNIPKVVKFITDKVEYPGAWRGDALFAIDCLCPKQGYERGLGLTVKATYTVNHTPVSEACPTIEATPMIDFTSTTSSWADDC